MSKGDIAINAAYVGAVSMLRSGAADLAPSTADVKEVECRADAMKKYREKLSELEALLKQYKALLDKDQAVLKSVNTKLVEADEKSSANVPR